MPKIIKNGCVIDDAKHPQKPTIALFAVRSATIEQLQPRGPVRNVSRCTMRI